MKFRVQVQGLSEGRWVDYMEDDSSTPFEFDTVDLAIEATRVWSRDNGWSPKNGFRIVSVEFVGAFEAWS